MMPYRPKIKLSLTPFDKATEFIGWSTLAAFWIIVIYSYKALPDIIPTHYNAAGNADGFGEKSSIVALPIIATVIFVALTVLNRYPHIFNFPTEITPENAEKQYIIITRMIRVLKLTIVVIFGGITYQTILTANSTNPELGSWFLPVTIALIFVSIFYFLIKAVKN